MEHALPVAPILMRRIVMRRELLSGGWLVAVAILFSEQALHGAVDTVDETVGLGNIHEIGQGEVPALGLRQDLGAAVGNRSQHVSEPNKFAEDVSCCDGD